MGERSRERLADALSKPSGRKPQDRDPQPKQRQTLRPERRDLPGRTIAQILDDQAEALDPGLAHDRKASAIRAASRMVRYTIEALKFAHASPGEGRRTKRTLKTKKYTPANEAPIR